MGKLVHSGPRSSRQGARRSTIVTCRGATWHSTRTWPRACSGTRAAHHRCTRATSSSGKAIESLAVRSLDCGVELVECGVQSLLPAPLGLVVGFGGYRADQLIQIVVGRSEDGPVTVGADAEHQPFAVGVQQPQIAQRCCYLIRDDDLADGTGEGQPSPAQIERRILPVADHALVVADATLPADRRCRL